LGGKGSDGWEEIKEEMRKMDFLKTLVQEVKASAQKVSVPKAARKKNGQVFTPAPDGWSLVSGKNRKGEWDDHRKIIIWGVNEVYFNEGDIKGECMKAGLDGQSFEVRRTGRGKGRRVEILFKSNADREHWFEPLIVRFQREERWRAVRGRSYVERAARRKASGQVESDANIAITNYYAILEKIGEGENAPDDAAEVRKRSAGSSRGGGTGSGTGRRKNLGSGKSLENKDREGKKGSTLRVGTWNVNGIADKWDSLVDVIETHDVDILGVCEHWMRPSDTHKLGHNSRYVWFGKVDRDSKDKQKGVGGVGFLVDSRVVDMVSIVQSPDSFYSSRHMWLKIRINGNISIFIAVVYMPVDNRNLPMKKAILEEVTEQCNKLRAMGDVFIVGDLNARVGKRDSASGAVIGPYGEDTRNRSGSLWIDWLKKENMFIFNGRDEENGVEFTRIGRGDNPSQSILDYIIGPEDVWKEGSVKKVVVAQGVNDFIGSDHRLVYAVIEVRAAFLRQGKRIRLETWKIRELRDREKKDKDLVVKDFSRAVGVGMRGWAGDVKRGAFRGDPDRMYAVWKKGFEGVCNKVVGKSVKFVSKRVKRMPTVFKRLLQLRNVVRKEAEVSGSKVLFDKAAEMSDKIKTLISCRNRRQWESFCAEVKTGELGPREFFVLLKRVIGSRRGEMGGIRNADGDIVSNEEEVRGVWRDFFFGLGKDDSQGKFDDNFKEEVEKKLQVLSLESKDIFVEGLDEAISDSEILRHLKQLRNFKAAGVDGIKNELLKLCVGEEGIRMVSLLLNYIWENEVLPHELTLGRIVTLFKGGDLFDPGDYRGITLLSVVYKLLSAILNSRLSVFCEKNGVLGEEQGGFREGRGCPDQLFSLYSIVGERLGKKQPTFLCFIDIKKAYDKVWRDGLWLRLADSGIKGKLWRVIRGLYASTESSVFVEGKDSDLFNLDLGVRQGDVLSPLLFSIFFNGLIDLLREKGYGVKVVRRQICGLWYADDIVLLAESADELREMMVVVDEYCFKWRCSANAKKSGVMIVGEAPKNAPVFTLNGEIVPIVETYKYLGVVFNSSWNWNDHVDYVLTRTETVLKTLEWRFWKNRAVDNETKVIAWRSIFRPAIEYGSEVWWPLAVQLAVFERLQLKVLKWILSCAVTTPTEIVRGDLGVPTLESRFVQARLSWAGVVKCMPQERIAGICVDVKTGWTKRVMESLKDLGLKGDFEGLSGGESEEARKEILGNWKATAKGAVMTWGFESWQARLLQQKKAVIYMKVKQAPGFEPFLGLSEFKRGGSLRFKLRSGMLYLNDEIGRRAKSDQLDEVRHCTLCDLGEVEEAEHFLFQCPFYNDVRDMFYQRLSRVCEKYGTRGVLKEWETGPLDSRFIIVLGDSTNFCSTEIDQSMKPRDAAREIRLIANYFISDLWNARIRKLYPDSVYTDGAIEPLCGSAS
jgi:exonuclease III